MAGGPGKAATFDGGTSNDGSSVDSNDVRLSNLQAKTTAGGSSAGDAIGVSVTSDAVRIVDCTVAESDQDGIFAGGSRVIVRGGVIKGPIDRRDILLGSNSQFCVVDGNIASVTTTARRTTWSGTTRGEFVYGTA